MTRTREINFALGFLKDVVFQWIPSNLFDCWLLDLPYILCLSMIHTISSIPSAILIQLLGKWKFESLIEISKQLGKLVLTHLLSFKVLKCLHFVLCERKHVIGLESKIEILLWPFLKLCLFNELVTIKTLTHPLFCIDLNKFSSWQFVILIPLLEKWKFENLLIIHNCVVSLSWQICYYLNSPNTYTLYCLRKMWWVKKVYSSRGTIHFITGSVAHDGNAQLQSK